ncbi:MAG: cyclophilin-like fold protein [Anaerolineae bacterium]|jgi:hypothetical protein
MLVRTIKIRSGGVEAVATLHENATADAIWAALPISARGNRWGEEIYFEIPVRLSQAEDARDVLEAGELGYWPVGHAFCIFWGPTPASRAGEIRAYSPVNVFGQLEGVPRAFDAVPGGAQIEIERVE